MNREQFRQEKQKLTTMSSRDRFIYIWSYYKVPILIGLAILFLLFQVGGAVIRSSKDCMLYCAFINQTVPSETGLRRLEDDFYTREGFSGNQTLIMDTSINLDDTSTNTASSIVFQSLIGTDTLDVLITTEEVARQYHDQDVFLNLESILPKDLMAELDDDFFYARDSSGQTVPMGIYLNDSRLTCEYGIDGDSILGVCTLENHPEVIVAFVEFIFE